MLLSENTAGLKVPSKCQTLFPAVAFWSWLDHFGLFPKALQEMLWIQTKAAKWHKEEFCFKIAFERK